VHFLLEEFKLPPSYTVYKVHLISTRSLCHTRSRS